MLGTCEETVSILYALVFGAGEACVRIDLWSILSAFAVFMVCVVILQRIVRRLLARPAPQSRVANEETAERPYDDDPNYRESAIRSTRR